MLTATGITGKERKTTARKMGGRQQREFLVGHGARERRQAGNQEEMGSDSATNDPPTGGCYDSGSKHPLMVGLRLMMSAPPGQGYIHHRSEKKELIG